MSSSPPWRAWRAAVRCAASARSATSSTTINGATRRAWRFSALARIAHPSSVPLFRAHLADKDEVIRRAAIEGLARAGDTTVLPQLQEALGKERNLSVVLALAFGVQRLGGGAMLDRIVAMLSQDQLRPQARGYLVELGSPVAKDLVSYLTSGAADVRLSRGADAGPHRHSGGGPGAPGSHDGPRRQSRQGGHMGHRDDSKPAVGRAVVLPRSFYARPTLEVAIGLLGKVLVHRGRGGTTAGIIVEAEAYIGEPDPACHAAAGPTARNEPMYGPPGHAYVYLNYGVHFLFNIVTEPQGSPAAVLIRALEPLDGIAIMRRRRASRRRPQDLPDHDLCRGPGNLTRALGITIRDNRADLCGGNLYVEDRGVVADGVSWSPRIGISSGTDRTGDARWRETARSRAAGRREGRNASARRGRDRRVYRVVRCDPCSIGTFNSTFFPSRTMETVAVLPIFASATQPQQLAGSSTALAVERDDHVAGPEAGLVGATSRAYMPVTSTPRVLARRRAARRAACVSVAHLNRARSSRGAPRRT